MKLNKHQSIVDFITRLEKNTKHNFEICDYWEADLCAIGIKQANKLVYISTYRFVKTNEPCYDFEFEIILSGEDYEVVKKAEKVSETVLLDEIEDFWN